MSIPSDLEGRVQAWIALDPDPTTRAELEAMLADGQATELTERFTGRVEFGTAGLRSGMYAGPTGMNRLVVRQTAAGIARHLLADEPDAATRGIVVTHDARHNSATFAADVAEVVAAHGIPVALADRPLPTPIGVFAVGHLGVAAAVVVTASHNPPTDNGLKLFMGDGAQIAPPTDAAVAAQIDAVVTDGVIVPDGVSAAVTTLDESIVEAYADAAIRRTPRPTQSVPIAMTAMHGVGGPILADLLARIGFDSVAVVERQQHADPDFSTVAFPNPEEDGATDLLIEAMTGTGAVVGLALDPDADRVAVCIPDGGGRQLTGDEVGSLLGEWLIGTVTSGPDRLAATTVVSSSRLGKIAERHGCHYEETLTGFKWLSRPALNNPRWRQVIAYEEAIGYAIGEDVFDKDGIGAALVVASLASHCETSGTNLSAMLDQLDQDYGAHVTQNFSLRYEGPGWRERRDRTVSALIDDPPERIGVHAVTHVERLAPDVLRVDLDGGIRVLVRPSGTEPKLKCYCEAVEPVTDGVEAARERARAALDAVRDALTTHLT